MEVREWLPVTFHTEYKPEIVCFDNCYGASLGGPLTKEYHAQINLIYQYADRPWLQKKEKKENIYSKREGGREGAFVCTDGQQSSFSWTEAWEITGQTVQLPDAHQHPAPPKENTEQRQTDDPASWTDLDSNLFAS